MARTQLVDRNELQYIPTPESTQTWQPIAHDKLVGAIDNSLNEHGLDVMQAKFEVSQDGNMMFGSYLLDQQMQDLDGNWRIGFRNSNNKKMAVGITAGTHIMVCSNMVFSGDFIEFRKHTAGLTMEELTLIANRAVAQLIYRMDNLEQWQSSLRDYPVSDASFNTLTIGAMRSGVFPPSKFNTFLSSYNAEASQYGSNLLSWHGGVTRALRDSSLTQIMQRTGLLNAYVNNWIQDVIDSTDEEPADRIDVTHPLDPSEMALT